MCERCETADALRVLVDAAVSGEALPRVCSAPECDGVPVARMAPDADTSELLCLWCMVRLGAVGALSEMCGALREAGVLVPEGSQLALTGVVVGRLRSVSEVL